MLGPYTGGLQMKRSISLAQCHQTYLVASAIRIATVTMTIAVSSQKLSAKMGLLKI
jgi:hypothetical protein